MTIAMASPHSGVSGVYFAWVKGAPILATGAQLFGLLSIPLLMAMMLDDRTLLGVNIWVKPLKFAASIAVYLATLAWAAQFLPEAWRNARWRRMYDAAMVFAFSGEMLWIGGASAVGITSHFNIADPIMGIIYSLMGVFATFGLTGALIYGRGVLKGAGALNPTLRRAVGWGLIVSFALTIIVAPYMASQTGHAVAVTTDGMMPVTGWALGGGDLRVSHFFAMHAMHFVPAFALAAMWLAPARAWGATRAFLILFCTFTLWTFAEAIMGMPFLGGLI